MEITCKRCSARYRAAISLPLEQAVRVACPSCGAVVALRPVSGGAKKSPVQRKRTAIIADEERDFRRFLGEEMIKLGFDVSFYESGEETLAAVRETRADLVILNVYLKGKLGVEISEEIKADETLSKTRVVLIGALFRANRFRANPTNLYGADDYIEELIPERELRQLIHRLFPDIEAEEDRAPEPIEYDEARRLARLILSDIVIYHPEKVERGISDGTFFDLLREEIADGRQYYDSRVPLRVRQNSEIFDETLHQFVQMKREETGLTGRGEKR
jgi:CheY-like chemotaxis protein